ncbi:MAG: acyltransferase [Proteobacteria bacterium]|nr:acyltransferase [Pseudomonadota bacterium]
MRFKSLDSWRGLCAILVALYHLGFQSHFGVSAFARGSFLFVDFFFVLSGFVMAQAYVGRLQTKADFTTFLIRRFGRLWPLHMAVLAAYFGENAFKAAAIQVFHLVPKTIPFTGAVSWSSLVANVFLLHSMGLTSELTWNGPSWSISAEFWAYMVFAAVLMRLPRALVTASLVISIAAATVLMTHSTEFMDTTFRLGFVRGLYGFFLGIIVHRCYLRWGQHPLAAATAWEVAIVVAVIAFVSGSYAGAWSYASPLVFAAAVFIFAHDQGRLSQLLTKHPFQALGTWSFSIYMVHNFLVTQLAIWVGRLNRVIESRLSPEQFQTLLKWFANPYVLDALTLVFMCGVILVSAQTFRWVEEPSRLYFNRLASARTAAAQQKAAKR